MAKLKRLRPLNASRQVPTTPITGEEISQATEQLTKKVWFYRILSAIFLAFNLLLLFPTLSQFLADWRRPDLLKESRDIPHYSEVKRILNAVAFNSDSQGFTHPEVKLTIDFDQKIWTLHDVFRFDLQGKTILREGRYGLCNELCNFVSDKIRPVFSDRYKIDFVRAAESSFFFNPQSAHFVLRVTDNLNPENIYVLDPSFNRYKPAEKFFGYAFFEAKEHLDDIPDASFKIKNAFPIMIKKDFLIHFVIDRVEDQLDRRHFALMLYAIQKHKLKDIPLFGFRLENGNVQNSENQSFAEWLMGKEEYARLRQKIVDLGTSVLAA